jgi:hypothetical protein
MSRQVYYLVESTRISIVGLCAPESGLGCSNSVPTATIDRGADFLPSIEDRTLNLQISFYLFNESLTV